MTRGYELPAPTPGLARRHNSFPAVAALADQAVAIEDMTYRRCEYTLKRARGLLELSRAAHAVLLLLLDRLTHESWARADYVVWPSNATLAEESGDTARSVRRCLSELEAAGLIARWYTPANRRMSKRGLGSIGGGIDLAPLAARFLGIEDEIAAMEQRRYDRRDAVFNRRQDISWKEDKAVLLEQSPKTSPDNTVTDKLEPTARFIDAGITIEALHKHHPSGSKDPDCSPGGETGFSREANLRVSSLAETARAEILAAYEASPTLRQHLPHQLVASGDLGAIFAAAERIVAAEFPERNTVTTWHWVTKHGWMAFLALAVALDYPGLRSRSGFLGWAATQKPGQLDLRWNIGRMSPAAKPDTDTPAPENPQQPADLPAPWAEIREALARRLPAATLASWIDKLRFERVEGDQLILTAPSRMVRDWVMANFAEAILAAAADFDTTRLEITVQH
jgi:hypothetical protein